jgi:hypothetical protein
LAAAELQCRRERVCFKLDPAREAQMTEHDQMVSRTKLGNFAGKLSQFRYLWVGLVIVLLGLACEPLAHRFAKEAVVTYAAHLGEALVIARILAAFVGSLSKAGAGGACESPLQS